MPRTEQQAAAIDAAGLARVEGEIRECAQGQVFRLTHKKLADEMRKPITLLGAAQKNPDVWRRKQADVRNLLQAAYIHGRLLEPPTNDCWSKVERGYEVLRAALEQFITVTKNDRIGRKRGRPSDGWIKAVLVYGVKRCTHWSDRRCSRHVAAIVAREWDRIAKEHGVFMRSPLGGGRVYTVTGLPPAIGAKLWPAGNLSPVENLAESFRVDYLHSGRPNLYARFRRCKFPHGTSVSDRNYDWR